MITIHLIRSGTNYARYTDIGHPPVIDNFTIILRRVGCWWLAGVGYIQQTYCAALGWHAAQF